MDSKKFSINFSKDLEKLTTEEAVKRGLIPEGKPIIILDTII